MGILHHDILLLRHAESKKNIHHIHGGQGEELTMSGINQARDFANRMSRLVKIDNFTIYACASYHTMETAAIIGDIWAVPVESPVQFKPLFLGIADGISDSDLENKNPVASILMQQWRNREIDIKRLMIPGMESYLAFWDRGINFLNSISHNKSALIVCTNSLMILLYNIMMGFHPEFTDKYKHIPINNCESIAFKTTDFTSFSLNRTLTNVTLYL